MSRPLPSSPSSSSRSGDRSGDRRGLQPPAERQEVAECALQLRRIRQVDGDKWNLPQKILNLLTKLFCPET
ncbi:LOW QUALITY PROTEIN: phorbol-12-myristate-13-acetate-induced protein 1 [Antrostomus carolinensis]|uniref:LOW QUALITY PROTEIN: phorbol-12-myristate-13-acetate-induced protein 1 n=1 Tax=Antrostomus carolinensis TaxID=279965 RepID=UPI0005282AD6|nr:LOW QUALITY PROTEIN: phorbol-12-myristate-13-acetate-induced protein 1 [Antrostomus carolinensis]